MKATDPSPPIPRDNLPPQDDLRFPLADGGPPPAPDTEDPDDVRKLEFLSIYHRLNVLTESLLALRKGGAASGDDEGSVLQAIDETMKERDALEDELAAIGFIGEAVMEGVFVVDVRFSHARPQAVDREQFSTVVSVAREGDDD